MWNRILIRKLAACYVVGDQGERRVCLLDEGARDDGKRVGCHCVPPRTFGYRRAVLLDIPSPRGSYVQPLARSLCSFPPRWRPRWKTPFRLGSSSIRNSGCSTTSIVKRGDLNGQRQYLRTVLLSGVSHTSVLVGFLFHVTVRMCLTVLDSVLDEASEGPLDADFPQATEWPLLGEYGYRSDADLSNGIVQRAPPTLSSTPEQDQVAEGCRLS